MNSMKPFELTILSSPGLKKSTKAIIFPELGEDAAGCKIIKNYLVAWVADGAPGPLIRDNVSKNFNESNEMAIGPLFGSRTLARSLGEAFFSITHSTIDRNDSPLELDEQAISELLRNKTRKLIARRLLQFTPILSKMDLPMHASGAVLLEWSASFLGVILNLKTQDGLAYIAGDCLGMILTTSDRILIGGNRTGRFFCRWKSTPEELREELFHVRLIKGKTNVMRFETVQEVVLMSDGVAAKKDLMNIKSIREIDYHCRSTEDDRTLVAIVFQE